MHIKNPSQHLAMALLIFLLTLTVTIQASAQVQDDAGSEEVVRDGTDPRDFGRRFQLQNEYLELKDNGKINTTKVVINNFLGLRGNFNPTMEIPLVYRDPNIPGVDTEFGLGDILFRGFFKKPTSKRLTFMYGGELKLPSAEEDILGTGKWIVTPMLGFVYALNKTDIFAPIYFHDVSFSGNDGRADIHKGRFRIFVKKTVSKRFYILGEGQIVIDYKNDNETEFFLAADFGAIFANGTILTVKPGIGIDPGPGEREWGVTLSLKKYF